MRKAIAMLLVLALACDPTSSRSHPGKTMPQTKTLGRTPGIQPVNDTDLPAIEDNASDCKDCTLDTLPKEEAVNCSNCPGDDIECRHCNGPEMLTISDVTAAFTAELKHRKLINDAQHVSFNDILIDMGNNINELGVFECPDSDVYFLSWSVHAYKGRIIGTLMKDGTMVKYGPVTADYTTGSLESGTSTMSSVVQCTAGSQFWVKSQYCLHLYSSADYCNYVESEYTSISGFKIFENSYSSKAAFTAQLSFDSTSYDPILFDQSVINIGNRYSTATGRFTCPRSGIYVFSTNTHLSSSYSITQLRRSDSISFNVAYACNTYQISEDSGTSSGTVVIQCSSNVYIDISGYSGITKLAETTSFSGFELVDPGRSIVAFHVRFSQNAVLLDGNTLQFDDVLTNEGGYYFPNVGLFVCPDDDIYFFSWSVAMTGNSGDTRPTEVRLMVGGNVWKKGPKTKENYSSRSSSASTQAIVQCEAQKAVWLEAVMSISPTTAMTFHYQFTYFTGFRIPNI